MFIEKISPPKFPAHQHSVANPIHMKKDLHPQYYPDAKVSCACGAGFTVGSTKPELHVEICGNCHPFYTGAEKIVDTAGRVERFKSKVAKTAAKPRVKKTKK